MSNGDPFDSDKPRGKSNAKRMGRYDGSYTPTEQRLKDSLMKQFCRDEGPPPSSAYLNAPCWCECGRLKAEGKEQCQRCLDMDTKAPEVRYSGNTSNLDEFIRNLDPTISSEPLARHLAASGPMVVMGVDRRSQPEPYATGVELVRLLK